MTEKYSGKIAKIRLAGYFTKGMVYMLLGTLTFMAAFDLGGDVSSRDEVIDFLLALPFGKVLVGLTALGLLAYTLWRIYQTFFLPKKNGNEKTIKHTLTRLRYFYSSLFYGFIAYSFLRPLLSDLTAGDNFEESSQDNGSEKAALWELLSTDAGKAVIWSIAIILAAQAIWQFSLAYKANFMKKIDKDPKLEEEYYFIKRSGRFGHAARGVVFGIIAFFMVQVILQHNANAYRGTEGALQYLLSFSYGSFLLGTVALGLMGYGIFNIMVARHANIHYIKD